MAGWFTRNWFLLGLIASGALAFVFPDAGAREGLLRTELTTQLGVALLFFIRGILLPLADLKRGVLSWRLHLLVHAFIFLLVPLGVFLVVEAIALVEPVDPKLRLGFVFLGALPTTVSTAAAFTSMARGNTAAAVFNATASNCLGVIIVPLWVAWMLKREAGPVPVGPVILQIMLLVLVPLAVGQVVKPWLRSFPLRYRKELEIISSVIVLFVIFAAFANSVVDGVWRDHGWSTLAGVAAVAGLLFLIAAALSHLGGIAARLDSGDAICLLFCGPQKTLAGGVTIANVMFAGDPGLTFILLPVLFYHFIQLFLGGMLVERLRRRPAAAGRSAPSGR